MPADSIKFQVLDVGQGSGNFVEMYNGTTLVNTVLIDLGSERATDVGGGLSVEFIVAELKTMAKPTIEYMFLSHSDTDHISLLDQLLDSFSTPGSGKPDNDTLWVNNVRYGGSFSDYTKGKAKKNVLTRLKGYMTTGEPNPWPAESSSYGTTTTAAATVEGVDFYLLYGNAPKSAAQKRNRDGTFVSTDAYAKNTVSLIVVVSFKGFQFVATGDATGATLAKANIILTPTIKSTYFPLVAMVTAPHHGSESTTFSLTDGRGNRTKTVAVTNFKTFVDNMASKTVTASAGLIERFKHPSCYLLSYFWPWLYAQPLYIDPTLTATKRHYYTAWFRNEDGYTINDGTSTSPWPIFGYWHSVQTESNIFSNTYFLSTTGIFDHTTKVLPPNPGSVGATPSAPPYPPVGVAWSYVATATETRVVRLDNRAALTALRREIIERSNPEDLARAPRAPRGPAVPVAPVPARRMRALPPPQPGSVFDDIGVQSAAAAPRVRVVV